MLAPGQRPPRPSALSASLTFGWRAMLKIKHVPEQLFDVTAFPIMMTLMFTYLFGGALAGSTGEYLQFLLPGILVTSVVMITMYTGRRGQHRHREGRLRPLPHPADLAAVADGRLSPGRRAPLHAGLHGDHGASAWSSASARTAAWSGVLAGVALLVVFSFAFSWIWTMFGLLLRTEKSVMGVSMLVLFPLTFLSNVFVDPETMPGWLQAFVNVNPITHLVAAVRALMAGSWDTGEISWVLACGACSSWSSGR